MNDKKEKRSFHPLISPKSTRGQGLSTTAIILIVIGIIILVVLVIGFSVGWGKIAPFLSNSNVGSVSTQCSTACTTNSVYDFCSKQRDLNDGTTTLKSVTCNYLSQKETSYGIETCPSISCNNIEFVTANSQADLDSKCKGSDGNLIDAYKGKTLQAMVSGQLLTSSSPCPSA